jgi:alkanesulfonate monooxygenase SsuD/methylene tetrahydromethanopterin reductase-like flavin-dependent oxidoreductase (luciferase family)
MALAIIGGLPERSAPMAELHRRAAAEAGHDPLPLSINSHGFISDTPEEAIEDTFASVASVMDSIGRERGWPPMTREQYEASATLRGANFLGSPQQVIDKILDYHDSFGHDLQSISLPTTLPFEEQLHILERLATEVIPVVRKAAPTTLWTDDDPYGQRPAFTGAQQQNAAAVIEAASRDRERVG